MNSLLLFPEELRADNHVRLEGARAHEVQNTHGLKPGISVAVAVMGAKLGVAHVLGVVDGVIDLEVQLERDPPPRLPLHLIVAVPRPQTIKKVVQLASTYGISSLHFVRSENSQKSYLQSKQLKPEFLRLELIKGLEQALDSHVPEVKIHDRFNPFVQDFLPHCINSLSGTSLCVIADTHAKPRDTIASLVGDACFANAFVAIGPESGWNEHEAQLLRSFGFRSVTLGPRMLRVETAASILIAQVELLRALGAQTVDK